MGIARFSHYSVAIKVGVITKGNIKIIFQLNRADMGIMTVTIY